MNSIVSPGIGKIDGQIGFFSPGKATSIETGNSEIKPAVRRLKTDLVSHPGRGEEVG